MLTSHTLSLYSLPLIAAVIGWFTNYLAVKMLFHPRKPTRLFFFYVQGVFPKRQQVIAEKLGRVVATELFTPEDITKAIAQNLQGPALILKLSEKIEHVLTVELPRAFPMLAMVMNPELLSYVQKTFANAIAEAITSFVQGMGQPLAKNLDIAAVVETKVRNFSSNKLEEILFEIMKREFRFIELVGAFLGFLIGLIQMLLVQQAVL